MTEFFVGAAIAIAAVIFAVTRSQTLKTAFAEWTVEHLTRWGFIPKRLPVPVLEPEIIREPEPEPEPVIEVPPPDYGNIRPVLDEELEPEEFGPEIHEFPEVREAVTRFEDFNRRLFTVSILAKGGEAEWCKTTTDDFATKLNGFSLSQLDREIRTRLRPRYPVVLDTYGYWASASRALEMNPDYSDDIVEAYLAIPEQERPVVVSSAAIDRDGKFILMRYGFEDFSIKLTTMHPYIKMGLAFTLEGLRGPRKDWLWFSVARLRQHVVRAAKADERTRLELEGASYLETQAEQARREAEHTNRFVKLFKTRIDQQALALLPNEAPAAATPSKPEATS